MPNTKTVAVIPGACLIELLELIRIANSYDVEPRLIDYLQHCRRTGYEPPAELLQLARDHIALKRPIAPPRLRRRASDFAGANLNLCGSH